MINEQYCNLYLPIDIIVGRAGGFGNTTGLVGKAAEGYLIGGGGLVGKGLWYTGCGFTNTGFKLGRIGFGFSKGPAGT